MKAIIAAENKYKLNSFENRLTAEGVEIVLSTTDNNALFNCLETKSTDILIISAFFMKTDILETIRLIKTTYPGLKIIVILNTSANVLIDRLFINGADYVMYEPVDGTILYQRMSELCSKELKTARRSDEIEAYTENILSSLNISPSLSGYRYITRAVLIAFDDSECLNGLTKWLYPMIAKFENTTPNRVERSIRTAIEASYKKQNSFEKFKNLGFTDDIITKRPSNGVFIRTLFRYVDKKFN